MRDSEILVADPASLLHGVARFLVFSPFSYPLSSGVLVVFFNKYHTSSLKFASQVQSRRNFASFCTQLTVKAGQISS